MVMTITLALGALVMPQFGVRAHINHTYTAMVILIPLACQVAALRGLWIAMVTLLGVSHLLLYGFGQAVLLPVAHGPALFPNAQALVRDVMTLPAASTPDAVLQVQAAANGLPFGLLGDTIVTLLSPIVFVVAVALVVTLFRLPERIASGEPLGDQS